MRPPRDGSPTAALEPQYVKRDQSRASLKENLKLLVAHHAWMLEHHPSADPVKPPPDAKLRRFAGEADALDASARRDLELDEGKVANLGIFKKLKTTSSNQ